MSSASATGQQEAAAAGCSSCGGIGFVKTERGSALCSCQQAVQVAYRKGKANLPPGFQLATFASYKPQPHTQSAFLIASRYADEFPPAAGETRGLLMWGTVGTGKTHLASAIADKLCARGFQPLFVDIRELLDRLRRSYDRSAEESDRDIMQPILKADLVIVDELGATRPTDWAFETIELLIGGLYNRMVPTIVTTNLPNLPPGGSSGASNGYARSARPETLGDRIGARMFSRLQQMCRVIEISGPDWRARR